MTVSGTSDLVDFAATILDDREKAIRVRTVDGNFWLPKSQVADNGDGTFSLPRWLAEKKGLVSAPPPPEPRAWEPTGLVLDLFIIIAQEPGITAAIIGAGYGRPAWNKSEWARAHVSRLVMAGYIRQDDLSTAYHITEKGQEFYEKLARGRWPKGRRRRRPGRGARR